MTVSRHISASRVLARLSRVARLFDFFAHGFSPEPGVGFEPTTFSLQERYWGDCGPQEIGENPCQRRVLASRWFRLFVVVSWSHVAWMWYGVPAADPHAEVPD